MIKEITLNESKVSSRDIFEESLKYIPNPYTIHLQTFDEYLKSKYSLPKIYKADIMDIAENHNISIPYEYEIIHEVFDVDEPAVYVYYRVDDINSRMDTIGVTTTSLEHLHTYYLREVEYIKYLHPIVETSDLDFIGKTLFHHIFGIGRTAYKNNYKKISENIQNVALAKIKSNYDNIKLHTMECRPKVIKTIVKFHYNEK